MLFCKLFETIGYYTDGVLYDRVLRMLFSFELYNQTLLEVPGSDACGVKTLDLPQDLFHLIQVGFNILGKSQIVDDRFQIPPNIAVVLYTPNQLFAYNLLGFV